MEKTTLSDRENRLAQALQSGRDLVDAITGRRTASQGNSFRDALGQLKALSKKEKIPIAIIGGAAVVHHGYEYSTKDIDIAVSAQDFNRIPQVATKYGFKVRFQNESRFHELDFRGIQIEVIQEGAFSPDKFGVTMPHAPATMGVPKGVAPVNLAYLVLSKLYAGRRKDYTAIVEVLKTKSPADILEAGQKIHEVSPEYYHRFEALVQEAADEKSQDLPFSSNH